ncbi:hypothetical protein [Anaerophilus nitritogenes]|uniref:hypothetical protein n=1 Tax=Anaerophilus nitritogenes TaxID=2498136 RepID=UPI00101CC254|nr:hypothetical protein [Anaerophilus nitritogenes]
MKIPEKIKIGYRDYSINLINGDVIDGNSVCYGNIKYDDGQINISTKYSKDQIECTFIHEVLHGIDELMETNLEEEQIRKMAKGLCYILKNNKELFM